MPVCGEIERRLCTVSALRLSSGWSRLSNQVMAGVTFMAKYSPIFDVRLAGNHAKAAHSNGPTTNRLTHTGKLRANSTRLAADVRPMYSHNNVRKLLP